MTLDFEFACDQLNSTNHNLLRELALAASCQHILTMCIRSFTYMDALPLRLHIVFIPHKKFPQSLCKKKTV